MAPRKRIGIDIDGVMADFVGAFCRKALAIGVPEKLMPMQGEACSVWNWTTEQWGWTQEEDDLVWLAIKTSLNWWMTLEPLVSPADIANLNVAMSSASFVFITSRRAGRGLSVVDQTAGWLRSIGVDMRLAEGVIASSRKGELVRGLDLDAMLDDSPTNLKDIKKAAPDVDVVARRWPYNGHWQPAVSNLTDFLKFAVFGQPFNWSP